MLDEPIKRESFAFKDLKGWDNWESWTPVRVGWTDIGTPTVNGRFHVIGRQCFFQVEVIPGTTVATTAGTSYVELPIAAEGFGGDANMVDRTTLISVGACAFDVANSRVYVPSQVATGDTLVVAGWYEI